MRDSAHATPGQSEGRPAVSLRSVALPIEHGGWGLLGEPLLLGLVLAPSRAGAGIALAALGAFLARHPLRLLVADHRRGTRYPRTAVAERVAMAYGLVALAGAAVAAASAPLLAWVPLLLAAPLALAQLHYDARHQGRQLAPELLGGVALGSVCAALLLAGGFSALAAFGAWLLMAAKAVGSVLYVRARLRLEWGLHPDLTPTLASHAVGVIAALALAGSGSAPWLAVAVFALLLARAALGLSGRRRPVRPRDLGLRELGYGLLTAVLLAIGYGFDA